MALATNLLLGINMQKTNPLDLTVPMDILSLAPNYVIPNGTGAVNVMDRSWHDQRTVNASSNDDLDLNGVLVDAFGTVFSPARIKLLFIQNLTVGQTLTIGNATNPFVFLSSGASTIVCGAQSPLLLCRFDATGWVVTAGTGDILRVANSSGSACTYNIVLAGSST
jgi:hypothetical protein